MQDNIIIKSCLSGRLWGQVAPLITTLDEDAGLKRAAKIGGGFILHPVFAVAMAIEAIIRGIFTILVRLICIALPEESPFKNKILFPLLVSTVMNIYLGQKNATCMPIFKFQKRR